MRVCFVIPSLDLGGAERSLSKLANAFAENRMSIDIVTFSKASDNVLSEELLDVITVYPMQGRRSWDPRTWLMLRRILTRANYDVVVGWSLFANLVVCLVSTNKRRWRLILSERNYLPKLLACDHLQSRLKSSVIAAAVRSLYPRADAITANSNANLIFIRRFVKGEARYCLLPNMIDMQSIVAKSMVSVDDIKTTEGPKILSVGRLRYQKGFDVLLKALALIRQKRPWSLVIVGDGPEREGLAEKAIELGIESHIQWLGSRQNPFPFYEWADIVVVASRFEGFPNVPLEAMACGRAVVCTDCKTGPKELTRNGQFARLVPVENAEQIAAEILKLGDDPDARLTLGESARQHVFRNYDTAVQIDRAKEIFESVQCVTPGI